MVFRYIAYGLCIQSDVPCPELTAGEGTSDVTVRYGPVPLELENARAGCEWYQVEPQRFLLRIDRVARYLVTSGREIVIERAPDSVEEGIRLFLLGSAFGALLYQRGWLPMHASVVQVGERAVAFCGPSGAGKSTLASWLVDRGYALVGDDLSRFDLASGGAPCVWPAGRRLRLWQDALDALGLESRGLEREPSYTAKFRLLCPVVAAQRPLPLGAIYLLEWGALELVRLTGLQALRYFVAAAAYRGELLEPMGQLGVYWQSCAALLQQVPVFALRRPQDWSAMDAILALLVGHAQQRDEHRAQGRGPESYASEAHAPSRQRRAPHGDCGL